MLGVNDDCVDTQTRTRIDNVSKGGSNQQFSDTPVFHAEVAGEATDQHCGDCVVTGQLASEFFWQVSGFD